MRAVLALVALGMAQGATAQRKTEATTGSHIPIPTRARTPDTIGALPLDKARIAMAEFARCTVDRKSANVAKILRVAADRMETKLWTGLADDQCLDSGEMRFKPILMRGALFAELQRRRRDFEQRGKPWLLPVVPIVGTQIVDPQDSDPTVTALLAFATCVVDRAPGKAAALLESATASTAQNAAFATLGPELGPCLPQGAMVKLSKSILEGALGEALYRGHILRKPATETK